MGDTPVDLMVMIRYLPPNRSLVLPQLAQRLDHNAMIILSTFVDDGNDGTWDMDGEESSSQVRFSHPRGREHILDRDELCNEYFGRDQGFRVLVNEVHYLTDGRPVIHFISIKE
jgi:hypothetical protein